MSSILCCSLGGEAESASKTLAVLLGWPDDGRSRVLVEADASGGDLAARFGLPFTPGLVELAADARRVPEVGLLAVHAQRLMFAQQSIEVVVAPASGARARVALPALAHPGSVLTGDAHRLVLIDAGRVDPTSPSWPLLSIVDVVLVVVPARVEGLARLEATLPELRRTAGDRLLVVLSAGERYDPQEVAETLDVAVWGAVLPEDRDAARVLSGRYAPRRWWGRLPLMVATRALARHLSDRLGPVPSVAAGPEDEVARELIDGMAGTA